MATDTLLVEIGTEELPPKSLNRLRLSFGENFSQGLKQAALAFSAVSSFATPRRLAVVVEGLADRQADQPFARRGPARAAAFNAAGEPTKALLGFMKGCGIDDAKQLDIVATDKGEYLVHRAVKRGLPLAELLEDLIAEALAQLPVERRMRWGKNRREFVRPALWAVCLYGDRVVPVSILGLTAGRASRGHRFMSRGQFELAHANDYVAACRNNRVIADPEERKARILEQITRLAAAEGGQMDRDEDLLEEVTSLVEWPVALTGRFDAAFLAVPPEVLISAMKTHQRCFHLTDAGSNLLPKFITIANIDSSDPGLVIAGNERVIRPRLADAAFFYHRDISSRLSDRLAQLGQVVFQAALGSYRDKAERISLLAGFIAAQLGADKSLASRAGLLCKADLVSDMVAEFPHLQGIMGGYYARHDGEPGEIVKGIAQHYRPVQSGGPLPEGDIAAAVALADKMDSLTGLFGIGQPPTGSKDPFALRRQALGIIRICIENQLGLAVGRCLDYAASLFGQAFDTAQVRAYLVERLNHYYEEQGMAADVVAAATGGEGADLDLRYLDDVVKTLQRFRTGGTAESIVAANKRVANLLRKSDLAALPDNFDTSLAGDEAELTLHRQLHDLDLGGAQNAAEKLVRLAVLQQPIDRFFDAVLVMADDEQIRNNRLALLRELRRRFLEVADFSLLQ